MTDLTTSEEQAGDRVLNSVHCLLIPLLNETMVLPNAAVAEVIGFTAPTPVTDAPDWLLGRMTWRDHRVPVISLEAAMGKGVVRPKPGSRIAVLNTLNGNASVPYVGVLTQGIPRLQVVPAFAITPDPDAAAVVASVASRVRLNNEVMLIPDLDDLEQRLVRLHR